MLKLATLVYKISELKKGLHNFVVQAEKNKTRRP